MKVDFELIDSILKDHNYDATQVIGIMQDIQKEYRYLPEEGLKYAAEKIGISPAKIYGHINVFPETGSMISTDDRPSWWYLTEAILPSECTGL